MAGDVRIKEQVYKDPRPPELFDRYHARVRRRGPEWPYELVRVVTVWIAIVLFRAQAFGAENVPNGPVIIAPNHASFMDHFFTGAFVRRHIQFMAKSQLFGRHPMSWIYNHGGVFPVRRGFADEEAFITAFTILRRGGAIGMYVEGGRSRSGELGTQARRGIGRLALESGAAVVPVAILGSHQVRNWKRLRFPKVVVRYGRPFRFAPIAHPSREQEQAAADEILRRIRRMHDELAQAGPRRAAAVARRSVLAERG
ncbi:MAG TPA: lysophospholipid acyltransferase family protein [Solirubrobacteraceae bacterium]|nr:lysophospholipid acyltransferase family protein [Solirubrobacteraceae bacterium]